jgi:hypothetical protein
MAQLDTLKMLVSAETDLARYKDSDDLLNYALSYASAEILKRRGADTLEDKYQANVIEGAKWYLSRIGAEGVESISDNGEAITYQKVPSWLQSVIPRLGTVRSAGT